VQVKSSADQRTFDANVALFEASGTESRFFFVCHGPRGSLTLLAEAIMDNAGLKDMLSKKW